MKQEEGKLTTEVINARTITKDLQFKQHPIDLGLAVAIELAVKQNISY
jgi:hypothetical protein